MAETRETQESLSCAIQEQALRVNVIKYSTDKRSDTSLCRLCNKKTESVTNILSERPTLAKSQYKKHH